MSLDYSAQVDATNLTVSTFSWGGALVEGLASDGLAVALAPAGAMVLLISTLCPTRRKLRVLGIESIGARH